jgi:hypothetical protein
MNRRKTFLQWIDVFSFVAGFCFYLIGNCYRLSPYNLYQQQQLREQPGPEFSRRGVRRWHLNQVIFKR